MTKRKDTIEISVTTEDIKNGIPVNSCDCPVALALRRATGRNDLYVLMDRIEHDGGAVDLPIRTQRFIARFDNDQKVKPFTFHLPRLICG